MVPSRIIILVSSIIRTTILCCALSLTGCAVIPQHGHYTGPEVRPADVEQYYSVGSSFTDFSDEVLVRNTAYTVRRLYLETATGGITVDYFQRPEKSDDLIFVFPILGGTNVFENYVAQYFAERGFDAAVIHRNNDFKNPRHYDHIEEIFRDNVVKDRIVLDFFEKEYAKHDFATFGISRGAINAATSAGADPRFKYNVLVMGGSDVVKIFRDSKERGIKKYRKQVMAAKGITKEQFFQHLTETVKTDPKNLAKYIDSRNTLMFLSLFDHSVPLKYGLKLKRDIGQPKTIFLVSSHYSTVLYTQFVKVALPIDSLCLFPLDYVEAESLAFYKESFGTPDDSFRHFVYTAVQTPIRIIAGLANWMW